MPSYLKKQNLKKKIEEVQFTKLLSLPSMQKKKNQLQS